MPPTTDELTDSQFGISTVAIKLSRTVEYYQFEENVSTNKVDIIGGGQEEIKTYAYDKKWVSSPINSEKFTDLAYQTSNLVLAVIESEIKLAENVTFEAYRLPPFMVRTIGGSINLDFTLSQERIQYWEQTVSNNLNLLGITANNALWYFKVGIRFILVYRK